MSAKFCFLLAAALSAAIRLEAAPRGFVVDRFSGETEAGGIPKGWEQLIFKKIPNHTRYEVVREGNEFYLKAASRNASSGLFRKVDLSPKDYPILKWRWKIENILQKADAKRKGGDDYPARVYVAFKYDPSQAAVWEKAKYGAIKKIYGQYPPKSALNYVWDNRLPPGTSLDNAYTARAKMIVVQSGKENAGRWMSEERDIYEDYRKFFGSEPPEISFIAVMTDTDNTGESATAYFDDIALESK